MMTRTKPIFIAQCVICIVALSAFVLPWPWGFFAAMVALFGSLTCIALSYLVTR